MQAAGGKEGPTVFLCPTDHDKIHSVAVNLESKAPKKEIPFTPDEWSRAKRLVEYLQLAIRKNKNDPNGNDPAKLLINLTKRELGLLHLIKQDAKYSNLNLYVSDIIKALIRSKFPNS
jgi:hypothetical protein